MAKNILGLIAIVTIAGTVGCSICCGPDDYNYGTYGGIHQRSDMQHGRVGSVFSDPNGTAIKLTPHGEVSESVTPDCRQRRLAGCVRCRCSAVAICHDRNADSAGLDVRRRSDSRDGHVGHYSRQLILSSPMIGQKMRRLPPPQRNRRRRRCRRWKEIGMPWYCRPTSNL